MTRSRCSALDGDIRRLFLTTVTMINDGWSIHSHGDVPRRAAMGKCIRLIWHGILVWHNASGCSSEQ